MGNCLNNKVDTLTDLTAIAFVFKILTLIEDCICCFTAQRYDIETFALHLLIGASHHQ